MGRKGLRDDFFVFFWRGIKSKKSEDEVGGLTPWPLSVYDSALCRRYGVEQTAKQWNLFNSAQDPFHSRETEILAEWDYIRSYRTDSVLVRVRLKSIFASTSEEVNLSSKKASKTVSCDVRSKSVSGF